MVGWRHVDVPSLDQNAILSKDCMVLSFMAQDLRQYARIRANMHNDENRRRAWNWQRGNNAQQGVKATSRRGNYYNAFHGVTLTPLRILSSSLTDREQRAVRSPGRIG